MQPDLIFAFNMRGEPGLSPHIMQGELSVFWRKFGYVASIPEILITIGVSFFGTVVLLAFGSDLDLPNWSGFLAGGTGAVTTGALFLVAMEDPELSEWAVTEELSDRFGMRTLRNDEVRRHVAQIISDRGRLERHSLMRKSNNKILNMLTAMERWLWGLRNLVRTIDPVMEDMVRVAGQKKVLLQRIAELEARAADTSTLFTRQQFKETIAGRLLQVRSMEELESQAEQAMLRLEHAASVFGAVDAKLVILANSGDDDSGIGISQILVQEEIEEIDAVVSAMRRVYGALG
jgi:hypothetical protein